MHAPQKPTTPFKILVFEPLIHCTCGCGDVMPISWGPPAFLLGQVLGHDGPAAGTRAMVRWHRTIYLRGAEKLQVPNTKSQTNLNPKHEKREPEPAKVSWLPAFLIRLFSRFFRLFL